MKFSSCAAGVWPQAPHWPQREADGAARLAASRFNTKTTKDTKARLGAQPIPGAVASRISGARSAPLALLAFLASLASLAVTLAVGGACGYLRRNESLHRSRGAPADDWRLGGARREPVGDLVGLEKPPWLTRRAARRAAAWSALCGARALEDKIRPGRDWSRSPLSTVIGGLVPATHERHRCRLPARRAARFGR